MWFRKIIITNEINNFTNKSHGCLWLWYLIRLVNSIFVITIISNKFSNKCFNIDTVLLAINGTFLFRTFLHPSDQLLKNIFSSTRKMKCDLVLGDWLLDDYDERLNQVHYFDDLDTNINNTRLITDTIGSDEQITIGNNNNGSFNEFMNNVKNLGTGSVLHRKHLPELNIDDVSSKDWCKSYRDAVNNRRIDLLAQVLNNCEGDKILMCVDNVDNIKSSVVMQLLQRRLTGVIDIGKPVLKYDTYYERVQVDI